MSWFDEGVLFKILKIAKKTLVKLLKFIYSGTMAAIKHSKSALESPCIFNIDLNT